MFEFLASMATGGVVGILGSLGTGVLTYFTKKSQNQHDMDMEKAKRDTLLAVTEAKAKATVSVGELNAFQASFKNESTSVSSEAGKSTAFGSVVFALIDTVRMLIRPVLTIVLTYITFFIYQDMTALVESAGVDALDIDQAVDLLNKIITMILSLCATAVGWYFSDRRIGKIFVK